MSDACNGLYKILDTADEILDYIENYDGVVPDWDELKIGDTK